MTVVPENLASIVVVAEPEIYELLRTSGVYWNPQHRIDTVNQMWDDITGNRLAQDSMVAIFSDSVPAYEGELEAAIAAMAQGITTFVVAWHPGRIANLLAGIKYQATANEYDPNVPIHVIYPNSKRDILDGIRAILAQNQVPVPFPDQYAIPVDEPVLMAPVTAAPVFDPVTPVTPVQPVAPVVQAPVAVEPVELVPVAPVQPAPVAPVQYTQPIQPVQQAQPAQPAQPGYTVNEPVVDDNQPLPGQVTITVTSSKGGSGKSTTAMMMASQVAQSSQLAFEAGLVDRPLKVCLVDMDTRDGQVASLIGKYVPTALNIRVSPTWDKETILANLVHDPKLGIDALLAPVRPRTADDVGPDFYREIIRTLKTTHDVVIMDTSVNYLDPLISTVCLPEATAILFVTTLATTSVQGMARALREMTEPVEHGGMGVNRNKIGIVINQAITDVGMDRNQVLQAALKVAIVGAIPFAARDVLISTNYNRMHQLLKHPLLGPAYFKLVQMCLPKKPLLPVLPPPAPVVSELDETEQVETKRGFFGRKG